MILRVRTARGGTGFLLSGKELDPNQTYNIQNWKGDAGAIAYMMIDNLPSGTLKVLIDNLNEYKNGTANEGLELWKQHAKEREIT